MTLTGTVVVGHTDFLAVAVFLDIRDFGAEYANIAGDKVDDFIGDVMSQFKILYLVAVLVIFGGFAAILAYYTHR